MIMDMPVRWRTRLRFQIYEAQRLALNPLTQAGAIASQSAPIGRRRLRLFQASAIHFKAENIVARVVPGDVEGHLFF